MIELNMHPTWSYMKIIATCIERIPSVAISCVPFRHFVLLEKHVYNQGPIACNSQIPYTRGTFLRLDYMYVGSFFTCDKKQIAKTPVFVVPEQVIGNWRKKIQLELTPMPES